MFFLLLSLFFVGRAQHPLDAQHDSVVSLDDLDFLLHQIDESLLTYYLSNLVKFKPRYTGTISCMLAAEYIFNEFQKLGLETVYHSWRAKGFTSSNVVATLPGSDPTSTAVVIVCAHYDTVPTSPGANDDGSGVAAVLSLAAVMRNYMWNHTIRFIAFSGEEVGTLGSFSYARDQYRQGENVYAVFNLDMIGYADTELGGKTLRFFPTPRARWIAEDASTIIAQYQHIVDIKIEILPNYIGSDAQPFIDYGYDAVWISHYDGYVWGHSVHDSLEHINWSYLVKATQCICAVLGEFARKPIPVQIIIRTPYEGYLYFCDHPCIKLDLGKQWYKGLRGITVAFGRPIVRVDVLSREQIRYIVFCIDGNFMYWDTVAPYEWKLQGLHYPPIGRHTVQVYAYTTEGNIAVDEMQIIIFTLSCQYS